MLNMNIPNLLYMLSTAVVLAHAARHELFQLDHRAATVINKSTSNFPSPSSQVANACASISVIASSQAGDTNHTMEIPAQLAYDCLQSVPLVKANASRLVQSFRTMFEFQSTTAFNRNPPSTYRMPAIDAAAVFEQIEANITSGGYLGEYDFQVALYQLVVAIHDDHLGFTPDLIGKAFKFTRPVGLTSLSKDGTSLPKLYVVEDLSTLAGIARNTSAVTAIDGQPADSFLEDLSQYQSGQDPDTNFNRLLLNLAAFSVGNETGAFSQSKLFTGANTTLQFENGSIIVFENKAIVRANFSGINSPEALYAQVCSPEMHVDDESGQGGSNAKNR